MPEVYRTDSINAIEFSSSTPENVAVDRPNNEVDFAAKVFNPGTLASMTLTGSIPMRLDRPQGC